MRTFLSRLALFLLIFTTFAALMDRATSRGLQQFQSAEFGTWSDLYHGRINAELVVVGSSRAMVHVSPSILSEQLGISVYNLGHNGQHFPMQRVRFEEYREFNTQPKWLIQTVDGTSLQDRETAFQYEQFLPWFHRDKLVEGVSHYKGFEELDRWLPMYRYRGRVDLIKTGLGHALGVVKSSSERDHGYIGRDRQWDGAFDEFARRNKDGFKAKFEESVEQSLDEFVRKQTKDGIRYVMVFTPEYKPAQDLYLNRNELITRLKSIAVRHGATFIDHSKNPICEDKTLFYNSQHMNRRGAERFSTELATELEQLVKTTSAADSDADGL